MPRRRPFGFVRRKLFVKVLTKSNEQYTIKEGWNYRIVMVRKRVVKKRLVLCMALVMGLCVLSGCSDAEVKPGSYISEDGQSMITIEENELYFSYSITVSYVPKGFYTVEGNRLTLRLEEESFAGEYVFKIRGDRLIFSSGPPLVKTGTVFTREE